MRWGLVVLFIFLACEPSFASVARNKSGSRSVSRVMPPPNTSGSPGGQFSRPPARASRPLSTTQVPRSAAGSRARISRGPLTPASSSSSASSSSLSPSGFMSIDSSSSLSGSSGLASRSLPMTADSGALCETQYARVQNLRDQLRVCSTEACTACNSDPKLCKAWILDYMMSSRYIMANLHVPEEFEIDMHRHRGHKANRMFDLLVRSIIVIGLLSINVLLYYRMNYVSSGTTASGEDNKSFAASSNTTQRYIWISIIFVFGLFCAFLGIMFAVWKLAIGREDMALTFDPSNERSWKMMFTQPDFMASVFMLLLVGATLANVQHFYTYFRTTTGPGAEGLVEDAKAVSTIGVAASIATIFFDVMLEATGGGSEWMSQLLLILAAKQGKQDTGANVVNSTPWASQEYVDLVHKRLQGMSFFQRKSKDMDSLMQQKAPLHIRAQLAELGMVNYVCTNYYQGKRLEVAVDRLKAMQLQLTTLGLALVVFAMDRRDQDHAVTCPRMVRNPVYDVTKCDKVKVGGTCMVSCLTDFDAAAVPFTCTTTGFTGSLPTCPPTNANATP